MIERNRALNVPSYEKELPDCGPVPVGRIRLRATGLTAARPNGRLSSTHPGYRDLKRGLPDDNTLVVQTDLNRRSGRYEILCFQTVKRAPEHVLPCECTLNEPGTAMLQVPGRKTKSLLDLANFFETLDPALYDQSTYYNPRTGARCICGWHNARIGYAEHDCDHAAASLGLSDTIAKRLFRGPAGQKMMRRRWILPDVIEKPTPKEAAACLRHLAVTSELPSGW